MRIKALLATVLIGIVLPGSAIADERAESFDARWPETPMLDDQSGALAALLWIKPLEISF